MAAESDTDTSDHHEPLLEEGPKSRTVEVDGHRLKLTHLDKVMYPQTGTTKRDVINFYWQVAPRLIEHAHDRPVTRKRWVDGVGTSDEPGESFFQKNAGRDTPDWVPRVSIEYVRKTNEHPLVNEPAVLVWLGQTATLEIHTPQWRAYSTGRRHRPDRRVLDLDPGEGVELTGCAQVALQAREVLADIGLDAVPVTSGSKGIHIYALLDGSWTWKKASESAHRLAQSLEKEHADQVTTSMDRAERAGKVFIDWSQNNTNKTTVAPWSFRGRLRPTVAVPRLWEEIEDSQLRQLDHSEALERLNEPDPLSGAIGRLKRGCEPVPAGASSADQLNTITVV